MKHLILIPTLLLTLLSVSFADNSDSRASEEALIGKIKVKADNAKDGDWKVLADCARTLLDQRINYGEVINWLETSVSLNESWYNLSLMGDYYTLNRDFSKAYDYYIRAIRLAQNENKQDMISAIQWKLLVAMGTRNYYDFLENKENN